MYHGAVLVIASCVHYIPGVIYLTTEVCTFLQSPLPGFPPLVAMNLISVPVSLVSERTRVWKMRGRLVWLEDSKEGRKIWNEASSVWIMLRNSDFILISSWVLRGVWYSFILYIDHPGSGVGMDFRSKTREWALAGWLHWWGIITPTKRLGVQSGQGTPSGCGFIPRLGVHRRHLPLFFSLTDVLEWKSVEERSQNDSQFARSALWDSVVGTWWIESEKQGDKKI